MTADPKNTRNDQLRQNIILLILAGLFALAAAEAGLRFYYHAKYQMPERYIFGTFGNELRPGTLFELIPGMKNHYSDGLQAVYSTNSSGFRATPENHERAAGEVRIAFLGESSVFGYKLPDHLTPPAFLERKLSAEYPDRKIFMINAGNPGHNSYQMLQRLQLRVLDYQPDIAVIYTGWNDLMAARFDTFRKNRVHNEEYLDCRSWQQFVILQNRSHSVPEILQPFLLSLYGARAWVRIQEKFSSAPATVLFSQSIAASPEALEIVLEQVYENLSAAVSILKNNGAQVLFVSLFSDSDFGAGERRAVNARIRRAAEENQAGFLDADKIVTEGGAQGLNDAYDRYHPTEKGAEFLAGLIAEDLRRRGWISQARAVEKERSLNAAG